MRHVRHVVWVLAFAVFVSGGLWSADTTPPPDASHMGTVYLVLLKKGPAWT